MPDLNPIQGKSKSDRKKQTILVIVGIVGVGLTYMLYRRSAANSAATAAQTAALPVATGTGGTAADTSTTDALAQEIQQLQSQITGLGTPQTATPPAPPASFSNGALFEGGLSYVRDVAKGFIEQVNPTTGNLVAVTPSQWAELQPLGAAGPIVNFDVPPAVHAAAHAAVAAVSTPKKAPVAAAGSASSASHIYTVASGDNLSEIASRFHESLSTLESANKAAIGPDPNLIHPGLRLTVA